MRKIIPEFFLISTGLVLVFSLCVQWGGVGQASAETNALDSPSKSARAASPASLQRMLDRYCITCHNEQLNTGSFRLDNIDLSKVTEHGDVWEKVIHKLRTEEMPPVDMPQPSKGARSSFLSYLVTTLDDASAAKPNPGRPAVHRLNRAEYENAIRDLLGLEIEADSLLPTDGADFGFDNISDSLNVSPMLLERYMMAATKLSKLAIGDPDIRPSSQTYVVPKELMQLDRMGEELPFGSRGGSSIRHHFPLDGDYVIKVNIESPRSDQPTDLFQRSDAPEQIDIRLDGQRIGVFNIGKPKSGLWSYGKNTFADGSPADKEDLANWWGARTVEARFRAKAGTHSIAVSFLKRTLAYEGVRPRHFPAFYDYLGLLKNMEPGVLDFEISGPFDKVVEGPSDLPLGVPRFTKKGLGDDSPSRQKIFTDYPENAGEEVAVATEILSNLARKAYRRPVTDADMDILLAFYEEGRSEGGFEGGVRFALERILVSPSFLFRVEADPLEIAPDEAYYLNDLELASRLSFFLWSSIPDDELLDAAVRGELKDPAVLQEQVARMLADPRSESLVDNFATQWLYLRNMEAVTPDVNLFPHFDGNLRKAMRRETELFFSDQLHADRGVPELLSANYTFLNERLAKHYGVSGVSGSHFRRVELEDRNRGGLLGHGSLMTVTSYATRTSPVKRGKWLLENILGTPPAPPPPDIPDLKEASDFDEATTVRQRMERHREDPLCASCHIKMDPLGFALENFNAIGEWRTETPDGLPVDSMGTLPDGTVLAGPAGLRDVLAESSEEFTYTAVQKLLTYALGRGIEYYDQPAVRAIMETAEEDGYRWSSIIMGIVESTPFQMRRASS